ncbi:hypothetical protein MycrhDRAFT_5737 [Mycolicibacterium rhodesiae JS60]|nr:hypothetical protein MycrhDRAFT_5737 [Mycolicibacterium rhodesiae JS60]
MPYSGRVVMSEVAASNNWSEMTAIEGETLDHVIYERDGVRVHITWEKRDECPYALLIARTVGKNPPEYINGPGSLIEARGWIEAPREVVEA